MTALAKIAYLMLCHENVDVVAAQARTLVSAGDYISIHLDARIGQMEFQRLKECLADVPGVVFAKRIPCGWGEWSLVQATLHAMEAADSAFPDATHFFMVSGQCMPIKPNAYIRRFLDENERDFIDYRPFLESDWVKVGLKDERLIYRHYFNERRQ
jgi:hypothetical protein